MAAVAGGLSKNKKSLPPHSGWRLNDRQSAIFNFISAKFLMGHPCASPYILFYMHGPTIFFDFELLKYHKITQIQNGR